jgi:hypothetical protein
MIEELAKRFEISPLTSLPDKVTCRVPIHFPSLHEADHRVRVSDQVCDVEELVAFPQVIPNLCQNANQLPASTSPSADCHPAANDPVKNSVQ